MLMGDDVPSWVDFVMQNASLPVLEDRGQAEAGSDDKPIFVLMVGPPQVS